jgi:hypothetical protein
MGDGRPACQIGEVSTVHGFCLLVKSGAEVAGLHGGRTAGEPSLLTDILGCGSPASNGALLEGQSSCRAGALVQRPLGEGGDMASEVQLGLDLLGGVGVGSNIGSERK